MNLKDEIVSGTQNLNKKILIGILGAILVIVLVCVVSCSGNGKTTIAFYGVEKNTASGIQTVIDGMKDEKGKALYKTDFIVLNSENPLSEELKTKSGKKVDLIVAFNGLALENLTNSSKAKVNFGSSAVEEMTSSVRGSFSSPKKIHRLPILMDHLELTVDRTVMEETRTDAIASWKNIESFCEKSRELMNSPIVFAGKDELFMMDFIGAMCEVISGQEAYLKAVKIITDELEKCEKKKVEPNYIKLASALMENKGSPLFDSISYLNKLYTSGYFSRESFSFLEDSVKAYMRANQAAVVVEFLSGHRRVPHDSIKRYSSTYIVSSIPAVHRYFVAPTVNVAVLSKNKGAKKIAEKLVLRTYQEQLSRSTGLAPVLATCMTPDKEADDVRYWVAATNPPSNGLSKDAFLRKKHIVELEKVLVSNIVK